MSRKYVEARNRATAKYTKTHYDSGNYKLPKGTRERILAQGSTVNGYINRSVLAALDVDENAPDRKSQNAPEAETQKRTGSENAPEPETQKPKRTGSQNAQAGSENAPDLQNAPETPAMKWYAIPADLVQEMEKYGEPATIILDGVLSILQEYRAGIR